MAIGLPTYVQPHERDRIHNSRQKITNPLEEFHTLPTLTPKHLRFAPFHQYPQRLLEYIWIQPMEFYVPLAHPLP